MSLRLQFKVLEAERPDKGCSCFSSLYNKVSKTGHSTLNTADETIA